MLAACAFGRALDYVLNAGRDFPVDFRQVFGTGVFGGDDGEIGQAAADLPHQPPFAAVSKAGAAKDRNQASGPTAGIFGDKRSQRFQRPFEAGRGMGEVYDGQKFLAAVHTLHSAEDRGERGDAQPDPLRGDSQAESDCRCAENV